MFMLGNARGLEYNTAQKELGGIAMKVKKGWIALTLLAAMCLCGCAQKPIEVAGTTWALEQATIQGQSASAEQMEKMTIAFQKDNSVKCSIGETEYLGTYTQEESKITIVISDEAETYTLEGETLIFTAEDGTITFRLQK